MVSYNVISFIIFHRS